MPRISYWELITAVNKTLNVSNAFWHPPFYLKQVLALQFVSKQNNMKFGTDYFARTRNRHFMWT